MKYLFALIIILALLSSCAPTQEQIEKAIQETQAEEVRLYTSTPADTNTPLPTDTPAATNTPKPTNTRRPTHTRTSTNTPKPRLGTFSNPFPFKTGAQMTLTTDEGEKVAFMLRVEEIIRGDEAWSIIVRANRFNDPPPDGFEPILVKVFVNNTSSAGFLELNKYTGLALATKGNVLDGFFYSPCCLDSAGLVEFDVKLNPSGEHTGWFAAAVHIDENTPMLVVGADRSGKGGIYFSLY